MLVVEALRKDQEALVIMPLEAWFLLILSSLKNLKRIIFCPISNSRLQIVYLKKKFHPFE